MIALKMFEEKLMSIHTNTIQNYLIISRKNNIHHDDVGVS